MSQYFIDLAKWFEDGKAAGHDYMIVIYDAHSRDEPFYPAYTSAERLHETVAIENGLGGSGVVREVFDLRLPIERLKGATEPIRDDKTTPSAIPAILQGHRSHPDGDG